MVFCRKFGEGRKQFPFWSKNKTFLQIVKNREYREKIECFQHSSQKQWVWSSHYLGKSLICGYRTLAGPPACRLRQWRHSSLAATSPISSYSSYCKWINRCFIPRASAQGGSAVFLVISNTRKTLTKKVGSSQTKMETTLLLPMHTCSLPHPLPAAQR